MSSHLAKMAALVVVTYINHLVQKAVPMAATHINHLVKMALPMVAIHINHYHLCSHLDSGFFLFLLLYYAEFCLGVLI
jgi:hypothetical protein